MPQTERQRIGPFGSINTLTINDGTFTEVHGNYQEVHLSGCPHESGLVALSQAISHGAIHDSAERYPAGICHPGTREEIIKTILQWIKDPNPSYDALWLYGSAGTGKSAIMQTIAELLRECYKDRYAGSFFFAAGIPGRNQGSSLFSTLAYQIAIHIPGMRELVNSAMTSDPTLHTKSMDTQIKSLIIQPFVHCPCPPAHTPTIIIDGLDECQGSETQRAILDLIASARTECSVPLRFLIASRPEFWIRDKFNRPPLFDMTRLVALENSRQTSQDVRKYLEDGFTEIYNKNSDIMTNIKKPWPPTKIIDRFVHDASGQFVYASTLLKFIGAEFCNPESQLDIICTPGPAQASAFSDLDQLYTKILTVYPRRGALLRVLGGMLVRSDAIEWGLDVERGELNMVYRAISSLIGWSRLDLIVDQDEDLEMVFGREEARPFFCHESFREYLMDRNRSGAFFVDVQEVKDELLNRTYNVIIGSLMGVHHVMPSVHNDMWKYLSRSISAGASPPVVVRRLEDLRSAIQQWNSGKNGIVIQPKPLLRYMDYAQNTLKRIRGSDNILSLMTSSLEDIVEEIETVEDECFQQILSTSSFLLAKNIPYFMTADSGPDLVFLDDICDLLKVNEEQAKEFLIEHAAILCVDFACVSTGSIEHKIPDTSTPIYSPICGLHDFLCSESRGGRFHTEYRKQFLRLSQQSLEFLDGENKGLSDSDDDDFPPYRLHFFRSFLTNKGISDVKFAENEEDCHNMRLFINRLCEGDNWTKLGFPDDHKLEPEIEVINWMHRQLNQSPLPPLLADKDHCFPERMLQTMAQIYEQRVLPEFMCPYFSHDLESEKSSLLTLTFPPGNLQKDILVSQDGISPYNIQPLKVIAQYDLSQRTEFWEAHIAASSQITTVLEDALDYSPPIIPEKCYTSFLESYLINYATYFHANLNPDSDLWYKDYRDTPRYFALWFSHAYSSKKILLGLWTIYSLCPKIKPEWSPPAGFCSGAMDYLRRYNLDTQGQLYSWLEDLIRRQR